MSSFEKVHAVVARSTFRSQNLKNTRASDHFLNFGCRVSKKCTSLWREEHFEVKMYKTAGVRTTFGSSDVASLQLQLQLKVHNCTTIRYTTLHYTTLHYTTLHNTRTTTTLHYTPLQSTTFHYTPLHSTTLHYTYNYTTTLHYTPLH